MKPILKILGIMLLCCGLYLTLWPVPVEPLAWQAPKSEGYTGQFIPNEKLELFESMPLDGLHGPEAVAIDSSGTLYATTHEGWVIRWPEGAIQPEKWANVGGRPLGLDFDSNDILWVANAYSGLQKVTPQAQVTTVVTEVEALPVLYADDVAVAPSGKIYFSDASTHFSAKEVGSTLDASLLDILEHSDNSRVIEFDPATGVARTVMDGITFANGVAMDPDGHYLLVVETGEYQVHKLWLSGDKVGEHETIIENLPGFPDNIHTGLDGRYWIGLTAPRSKLLDDLAGKPFMRKVVQRLPPSMRPKVSHYGMVIAIDSNGVVLSNLQSPNGVVYTTTGATESERHLYVTSLTAPFLARYPKSRLGL